ncbi:MAG: hypothetical protein JOY81_13630, partial [Alphaproteobacteria bacterium]|nr:hypothetical protein [Alphaproteobacteria bacterium]
MIGLTTLLSMQGALAQTGGIRLFRDRVLELLRNRYPDVSATAGPDDGSISIEQSTLNVHNLYAETLQLSSSERETATIEFLARVMEGYRRAGSGKATTAAEAKALLRPRLVSADYLQPALDVARRPFSPGIFVVYVIDYGRQVSFANRADLDRWQVDLDWLHGVAVANLEALSAGVSIDVRNGRGGRF